MSVPSPSPADSYPELIEAGRGRGTTSSCGRRISSHVSGEDVREVAHPPPVGVIAQCPLLPCPSDASTLLLVLEEVADPFDELVLARVRDDLLTRLEQLREVAL